MRKIVLTASAALLMSTALASAGQFKDGAFTGEVGAQVQRLINAYQRNHDVAGLKAAIAALVKGNPDLADDVVQVSQTAPPVLQAPPSTAPGKSCATVAQIAIADGLAAAWGETAATNPQKAASIKAAVGHGSECVRTAYNTEAASLAGQANATDGQSTGGGSVGPYVPPSTGTLGAADGS